MATLAVAGCQAAGEPPVAQWGLEPMQRIEAPTRELSPSVRSGRGGPTLVARGTGKLVGSGRAPRPDGDFSIVPKEGEEGVTLNLVNLPIVEASKVVLGDILGANYVVDPKLEGKVTVHTAQPVRKSAAIDLFQSALSVSGAALVENGGLYKVVPLDQAAVAGGPIASGRARSPSQQIGDGAEIVQLQYVSASEMRRVLEPIAQRGVIVNADDARHTLTLSGSPQDVATLRDAIAMFDIDTMRGMSFALVPVRSSDPDALADDLRNVFGSEKEGPMAGMIRFIGNKHLAAILVISSQRQYLSRAQAWIHRLDGRAQGNEKQYYTYVVQNRPAKELAQVLGSMFGGDAGLGRGAGVAPRFGATTMASNTLGAGPFGPGGGGVLGAGGALGAGASSQGGLGSSGPSGGPFGVSGVGDAAGSPPDGPSSSPSSGSGSGRALGEDSRFKLALDESKNALVIMATPDDYKNIMRVIEKLDVQPNQIFIEATIAEVDLTDEMRLGVRWFLQKQASTAVFAQGKSADPTVTLANVLKAAIGPTFPGFSYILNTKNLVATISALNAVTNVNIISTPSLTTVDNKQAVLQVGQAVPILTSQAQSVIGGISPIVNQVQYRDTGVILAITPHIGDNGMVTLEIEQEISDVDAPGTVASPVNSPTFRQRRVKTRVSVADNEGLMLGGLIEDKRTLDHSQVPVIGDVPLLGNVFKEKGDVIDKKELIILITPHIIRTVSEAQEVTDEFKRKLLKMSPRVKPGPHTIEQSARRVLFDQ